jgi:acid phosphatase family membrane protein YuiD
MPSGHSATVSSLAVICGLICGTGTAEFAIAAIVAIVVCHDAMGVRRETGRQAVVINDLVEAFNELSKKDVLPEVKLKEFVGHTPVQVLAGILTGIADAVLLYLLVYAR